VCARVAVPMFYWGFVDPLTSLNPVVDAVFVPDSDRRRLHHAITVSSRRTNAVVVVVAEVVAKVVVAATAVDTEARMVDRTNLQAAQIGGTTRPRIVWPFPHERCRTHGILLNALINVLVTFGCVVRWYSPSAGHIIRILADLMGQVISMWPGRFVLAQKRVRSFSKPQMFCSCI
jgi:hypothetical protein